MDLVHRRPLEPDRRRFLSGNVSLAPDTRSFLQAQGFGSPDEDLLWLEALTHGSTGAERDYQRLEFLGDRVLGLAIAEWLFELGNDSEGKLSQRLNALVSRQVCAQVAREIDLPRHIQLGAAGASGRRLG